MNKEAIGFLDSGMGGLSVLKETMKLLPNEDYLYYGDSINNPYGSKSSEELLNITKKIVDYLLLNKCKLIVIACNTATTSCMKKLREEYPNVIFIGTVPAIKVAYDQGSIKTLVMATPHTIETERVQQLITEYKRANQTIELLSCENLANIIETGKDEEIDRLLNKLLSPYMNNVPDTIVLGCTHYSLIKDKITKILPTCKLVDGNVGIAKEIKHQLEAHQLMTTKNTNGTCKIYNSIGNELTAKFYEVLDNYQI